MPKKKTKASKLAEKLKKFEPAAPDNFEGDLIDVLPEAAAPPPPPPQLGASQGDDDVLPGSFPMTDEDHEDEFHETHETQEFHESEEFPGNEFHDEFHDREFHDYERDYEAHDDDVKGKGVMVAEERRRGVPKEDREGQDEDEIVEIIDLSPPVEKKSKKSRKGKSKDAAQIPVPPAVPPPPPAVPEVPPAPPSPPVEPKSSRKERAKINRDGGASWGMWSASTTPLKEEKKSSKSRSDGKRPKKVREEKVSSKGSGSDKAERQDPGVAPASRSRINSLFQSTPPLSRSMSTRDKQSRKSSSRRHSVEMSGGLVSPPPEEMPEMASRAARVMGVDKSRSRRTSRMRTPAEDDDIVMVGTRDLASSPDKSGRKRSKVRLDDDIVMVDVGGPADGTPLRRSNSSAKKGISGLFGGLMSSTPRPEPRRRSTYHGTDDEGRPDKRARRSRGMSNAEPDMDADREARRAARRELREQEKAEEARRAKEARRERRKRQEEDEEDARRQEEREARRAERRVAREREAQRLAGEEAEAKEAERMERRRQRRIEKEAAAVEEAEADARRAAREERRRARHVEGSEEEEHRRLRREAKRAEKSSRSRPTPVDEYGYPRERPPRPPTDDEYGKRRTPTWPHSGTSSWVKEHSDAGPPPDDGHTTDAPQPIDDEEARRAARRAARRRERNGDASREQQQHEDDQRRRRARREERERRERRVGGSDGSGDKAQREAVFMDSTPRSSWWRKLTGS
ncbi:hypothetical protein F4802DRAFT_609692 [Xylaria palmicola]|nr:hypothetical protein F4802DRAFT_609692 [Xylaria palmicola]